MDFPFYISLWSFWGWEIDRLSIFWPPWAYWRAKMFTKISPRSISSVAYGSNSSYEAQIVPWISYITTSSSTFYFFPCSPPILHILGRCSPISFPIFVTSFWFFSFFAMNDLLYYPYRTWRLLVEFLGWVIGGCLGVCFPAVLLLGILVKPSMSISSFSLF